MTTIAPLSDQDFSMPIIATIVYFLVFQFFMVNQINCKIVAKRQAEPEAMNRFDYSNKLWEMGDRSFLNLAEQTPFFLTLMWMYAIFCGAPLAGTAGLWYCVIRIFFPIFWAVKGQWNLLIEISTQGCYTVNNYFLAALFYLVCTGRQLVEVMPQNTAVFVLSLVVLHVVMNVALAVPFFGVSKLLQRLFDSAGGELKQALL